MQLIQIRNWTSQGLANTSFKGPNIKHFMLCGSYGLCPNQLWYQREQASVKEIEDIRSSECGVWKVVLWIKMLGVQSCIVEYKTKKVDMGKYYGGVGGKGKWYS